MFFNDCPLIVSIEGHANSLLCNSSSTTNIIDDLEPPTLLRIIKPRNRKTQLYDL